MKLWRVDDVMTDEVVAVRGVSAVPVVDRFDRIVGLVSEADLLHKVVTSEGAQRPRIFVGGARGGRPGTAGRDR